MQGEATTFQFERIAPASRPWFYFEQIRQQPGEEPLVDANDYERPTKVTTRQKSAPMLVIIHQVASAGVESLRSNSEPMSDADTAAVAVPLYYPCFSFITPALRVIPRIHAFNAQRMLDPSLVSAAGFFLAAEAGSSLSGGPKSSVPDAPAREQAARELMRKLDAMLGQTDRADFVDNECSMLRERWISTHYKRRSTLITIATSRLRGRGAHRQTLQDALEQLLWKLMTSTKA